MQRAPDVKTVFKHRFAYTPTHLLKVPGGLELLGNHAAYNQGIGLTLAVDRYAHVAASPRNDGRIEVVSSTCPNEPEKFWLSEFKANPAAPWADPVKAVLEELRAAGVLFRGFNLALLNTIPDGLGGQEALAVAVAMMVRQLYPHRLTENGTARPPTRDRRGALPQLTSRERMAYAELCAAALNAGERADADLSGPVTSLFGKEFQAVQMDYLHRHVERLPLIGEIAVVLCDTGLQHPHSETFQRQLRRLCESAAQKLGTRSLRSVELTDLHAAKSKLTPREYACAYHIVGETQRVVFAERALREEDLLQFGQYLLQSHDSSRELFRNSSAELDLLVDLAREHPACLGARLSGDGYGGATVNLVAWTQADGFIKAMGEQYQARTGHPLKTMRCKIVDGAEYKSQRSAFRG